MLRLSSLVLFFWVYLSFAQSPNEPIVTQSEALDREAQNFAAIVRTIQHTGFELAAEARRLPHEQIQKLQLIAHANMEACIRSQLCTFEETRKYLELAPVKSSYFKVRFDAFFRSPAPFIIGTLNLVSLWIASHLSTTSSWLSGPSIALSAVLIASATYLTLSKPVYTGTRLEREGAKGMEKEFRARLVKFGFSEASAELLAQDLNKPISATDIDAALKSDKLTTDLRANLQDARRRITEGDPAAQTLWEYFPKLLQIHLAKPPKAADAPTGFQDFVSRNILLGCMSRIH